jgi:hypothetical protein
LLERLVTQATQTGSLVWVVNPVGVEKADEDVVFVDEGQAQLCCQVIAEGGLAARGEA